MRRETVISRNRKTTPAANGLMDVVAKSLDDDKAEDVVVVDLEGKSNIADFMVIASGRSQRHVGAIAEHLIAKLKHDAKYLAPAEGRGQCDWVLVDAGDVIVHIFRPEVRAFYNLEKMWGIDLPEPERMSEALA